MIYFRKISHITDGVAMDDKDESILKIVGRRSGMSSRKLSTMLNIPISTVHRRIKKFEDEKVITGYKALIDYQKTPWPIGALLLVDLMEVIPGKGHIPKKDIINTLSGFREIEEIIDVQAADFDLVIKARFRTLKLLSSFIETLRDIEGIEETKSAVITDEMILPPSPIIRVS
jgi:Lrp/AsnC family leucine-responsive transcriptional regulator